MSSMLAIRDCLLQVQPDRKMREVQMYLKWSEDERGLWS